jgi:hypothetical protein
MLLVSMMMLTGCNKWDDQPELKIDPWEPPQGSRIFDIGGKYVLGKAFGSQPDSLVPWIYNQYKCCIRGVVVSSDEGGNFYKSMVIQDETGGVALQLDMSGLYTRYPLGQKIVLVCNGTLPETPSLMIGNYHNLPQIGWIYQGGIGRINSLFLDQYIIRDDMPSLKNLPKPLTNRGADFLNDNNVNKLVCLEGVTFETEAIGKPLSFNEFTTDWKVYWPNGSKKDSVIVRTSNYAKFRSTIIQNKEYNLTGILTKYNSIYQLMIRVKEDIVVSANSEEVVEFDFTNKPLVEGGWSNHSQLGNSPWIHRNGMFHPANQYGAYAAALDDWLVSPVINYDDVENGYLRFMHQLNVLNGEYGAYQVYYTTSTAAGFNAADWKELGALSSFPVSAEWSNSFPLKNINAKKFRIAFRYNAPNKDVVTYDWSVKKVEIRNK